MQFLHHRGGLYIDRCKVRVGDKESVDRTSASRGKISSGYSWRANPKRYRLLRYPGVPFHQDSILADG